MVKVRRQALIVGNWKMHGDAQSSQKLACAIAQMSGRAKAELVICPPSLFIISVATALKGLKETKRSIALGAQDCHAMMKGPYTGDISASMLVELGCRFVILGHSERRIAYHETDEQICAKAKAALRAGLEPILCIGETSEQRRAGQTEKVLAWQVEKIINPITGLGSVISDADQDRIILAYEPIWAIGAARAADDAIIAHTHACIYSQLKESNLAERSRILYGGSVTHANASTILAIDHVDGVLVGGASLQAESFLAIAAAA